MFGSVPVGAVTYKVKDPPYTYSVPFPQVNLTVRGESSRFLPWFSEVSSLELEYTIVAPNGRTCAPHCLESFLPLLGMAKVCPQYTLSVQYSIAFIWIQLYFIAFNWLIWTVFYRIQRYLIVFDHIPLYYIIFNCILLFLIVFNSIINRIQLFFIMFKCIWLFLIVFNCI